MSFHNPIPVAIGLIPTCGGLVAVRRTIPPIGGWAFPGGYVNKGEDAETAVAREAQEETGFIFPPRVWTPVTTRVTPRNQLLIFLLSNQDLKTCDFERFVPNNEADAMKAVSVFDELCFPLH